MLVFQWLSARGFRPPFKQPATDPVSAEIRALERTFQTAAKELSRISENPVIEGALNQLIELVDVIKTEAEKIETTARLHRAKPAPITKFMRAERRPRPPAEPVAVTIARRLLRSGASVEAVARKTFLSESLVQSLVPARDDYEETVPIEIELEKVLL